MQKRRLDLGVRGAEAQSQDRQLHSDFLNKVFFFFLIVICLQKEKRSIDVFDYTPRYKAFYLDFLKLNYFTMED